MADAAIIIQFFAHSILSLVVLISIGILIAPIFAPQDLTHPLQVAGIASSLVRGAIVPRFWMCTAYLLFEFSMAVTFTGYLAIVYARVQATSFPTLCAIAALFGFIVFEVFFFEAANSSGKNLGPHGRFHAFLWRLLKGFGVALLWAIYGIWNAAAACQEHQPLDDEEHVGGIVRDPPVGNPIGHPPIANSPIAKLPIGDLPIAKPPIGDGHRIEEASPPPPYYTSELNDGILSINDPCELV